MRKLTILVLAVAAIYAGYWFVGASAAERAAKAAVSNMQAQGWSIEASDISTAGFPSRFDTTITDLTALSPDQRIGWTAPYVQALALSYKPNEVIIAFPAQHVLQLNGQDIALTTDGFRASASIAPAPSTPLAQATAELASARIAFTNDITLTTGKGLAALRRSEGEASYDAYFDLRDIGLPTHLVAAMGDVARGISQITVDADVVLDRPLDRHAGTGSAPQLDAIDLTALTIQWGAMSLRGKGQINIDPSGIPTGRITLSLRGWDQMIDAATRLGLIDPGLVQTAKTMATTMALGSDTLDLPLIFENGLAFAGPIPLGPAPHLR